MTCIVKFPTKKALKEAIAAGENISILNPSPFPCNSFEYNGLLHDMQNGRKCIVTNHPKRSWFGIIERRADGTFKVS